MVGYATVRNKQLLAKWEIHGFDMLVLCCGFIHWDYRIVPQSENKYSVR